MNKLKFIDFLQHRLKILKVTKGHYGQNPVLRSNVKMANVEIVQGNVADLEEILSKIMH